MYKNEVTKEREFEEFTIEYIGKEPAPEVFVYKIKGGSLDVGIHEETFNKENKILSFNVKCTKTFHLFRFLEVRYFYWGFMIISL